MTDTTAYGIHNEIINIRNEGTKLKDKVQEQIK